MREFKVIPHVSIGPAALGMTRDEIRDVLGKPSNSKEAHEKWGIHWPDKDCFFKNAFQVSYDSELKANFIEVSAETEYVVTFDGLSVHESDPAVLIEMIEKHGAVDKGAKEYPTNLWFPELCLNLYREHSAEDNFDTIGISTKTYADG